MSGVPPQLNKGSFYNLICTGGFNRSQFDEASQDHRIQTRRVQDYQTGLAFRQQQQDTAALSEKSQFSDRLLRQLPEPIANFLTRTLPTLWLTFSWLQGGREAERSSAAMGRLDTMNSQKTVDPFQRTEAQASLFDKVFTLFFGSRRDIRGRKIDVEDEIQRNQNDFPIQLQSSLQKIQEPAGASGGAGA
ncbi:MAG: hypothetical protein SFZ03_03675 [Candidatus Melainabacteria bacterium]|nr:hypothetical protein [Candidatus Melainabacteria bacterium]